MIRHRPYGSGHPYSDDTEQRLPAFPSAGERVTLGVQASADVESVSCELERKSATGKTDSRVIDLVRTARTSRGQVIDGGHLASAQARLARRQWGWQASVEDLGAGDRYRYRFTGFKADGSSTSTRWYEFAVARWEAAPAALEQVGAQRVIDGSVQVLHDGARARRIRFALPLQGSEHVTGLGERYDALDHRGSRLDSIVFEQYKSQGAERKTYLPMPFAHVIGGDGWGFHVRSSRRAWFDLGQTNAARIEVEVELDDEASELRNLLTVAFYDGSPSEVLHEYLSETGMPTQLPDWVFRLWASGNEWNTQAEVERQMALHREHDIPVGSVVIEAWSDESTFTAFRDAEYVPSVGGAPHRLSDFTFPADGAWPDPKGMVDDLHGSGIRVVLWQIPLTKMRPHPSGQARADADAAIRQGLLIREEAPDGELRPYRNRGWWFPLALMPDLTDERAATWWTEKRRYLVEEVGIDGFKTDGGEHAWGRDLVYLNGRRGDEMNNRFPVAYAKAYGELLSSAGKAPVTFSRAGFVGSPAHGAYWAGDENSSWQAFRWSMLAGLSAAASGILYWGWDIAGFSGEVPDAELYLRASAASVFVPIMQYHSEFNHHRKPSADRTPWNIAERSGDPRVIPAFRRLVKLREGLVPYLREHAAESIRTGKPLMRPLYFEYPDDASVWLTEPQWLLGDSILVAPVLEPGATTWPVYLPDAGWVDAWTGELAQPGTVTAQVGDVERIPVYVRQSAWDRLGPLFSATAGHDGAAAAR